MTQRHVGLALLSLLSAFTLACGVLGGAGSADSGTPVPSAVATLAAPSTAATRAPATPRAATTRAAVATSDAVTILETPVASGTSAASGDAGAGSVVVANTDGEGVFLRGSKQMADRLQAYADGTVLTVTGPEEEGEGVKWLPVQAPDGTKGWVPTQYTKAAS